MTCRTIAPLPETIPPHRAISLPSLHAYADRDSYAPGETVSLMVSNDRAYRLEIIRFGNTVDSTTADTILHTVDENTIFQQAIHPGSYVHVGEGLPAGTPITALTLECWVRTFRADLWAGLINQHDYPTACGYGIYIAPGAAITFHLGNGGN